MRNLFVLVLICLFACGCATISRKSHSLDHGQSREQVTAILGHPAEKVIPGKTPEGYLVEIWRYHKKKSFFFQEEELFLMFVDGEAYLWSLNNSDVIFGELIKLKVLNEEILPALGESRKSADENAIRAIETQKIMEILRSYQSYENTQRDIQTMQQMQTIKQQQLMPPPPPLLQKPAQPVKKP